MSTFMAKQQEVARGWFIIDAAGIPLGRVAAQAAILLHGKHKPEFTPHVDGGDFVIVVNSDKVALTGNKAEQKYYRRHSGYVGGLKETKYRLLLEKRSELAIKLAVKGMLPKNKHQDWALTRLKVYKGAEHPHAAQQPVEWKVVK
ncbi:50S ribosomal protein L13 [Clostridia bacterium]|nr:50S ribosomal protein L13 [Clostridia bacterium]